MYRLHVQEEHEDPSESDSLGAMGTSIFFMPLDSADTAEVLNGTHSCRWALFWTIFASCFLGNFFSYVRSPSGVDIGTVLYFTRLFMDLLSRPVAMYGRPRLLQTGQHLYRASLIRMGFLTVFFLYIAGVIPLWDPFIIGFVAVFSFLSGYFSVFAYQIAQECSSTSSQCDMSSKLMNTAFQIATFSSAVSSVALTLVLP